MDVRWGRAHSELSNWILRDVGAPVSEPWPASSCDEGAVGMLVGYKMARMNAVNARRVFGREKVDFDDGVA